MSANSVNLPLFYYPTTWLAVDDDSTLLNALEMSLTNFNHVKTFQSPSDCLDFIAHYQPPSQAFSFLQSMKDDENYGVLNHLPVDFDVTCLAKLANLPNKQDEISAMMIDFNMPAMDGIMLADELRHFAAKKILLTGKANTEQAITAFNDNLIQGYIQKSEPDMDEKLVLYLKRLTYHYFQALSAPLLNYLETDQKLPQSDPVFVDVFNCYCEANKVNEYYLIDRQGSMLLKNEQGKTQYFVIQTENYLESWLSFYSSENEIPTDAISAIKNKHKIPFLGLGQDLMQCSDINWQTQLFPAHMLEGREQYLWTVVELD